MASFQGMRFHCLVLALAALCASGCNNDPRGRQAISGTVNVDGKPLEKGNISFQPTEGQATSGGAMVAGGKFNIPKDSGLVPGKYRVSINAPVPGTGGKADENSLPGDPPAPPKELLPKDWNSDSKQFIEIKSSGPFTFPFEVATKAK
jgi:hypothetical protein